MICINLQKEIQECKSEEEVAGACDRLELNREAVMRDRRQCRNTKSAMKEDFDRKDCKDLYKALKRKKK